MIGTGLIGVSDWMLDTFLYTALLIGIVLLVRRPVTRHFGPQIAYALWALPLLRFVMPPIVLPAWMAPAEPVVTPVAAETAQPLMLILSDPAAEAVATTPEVGISVSDLLLPLWLAGATVFLLWRARDYVRMRRDLLADARPMGESGNIRLVETPAVSAPVAFGIRDKVVALPVDFMALLDVKARDMAIAHELEHHRGHDLLANIAAQPLLALHWFNPLAWWGWRAMRRDQEAACDARVVAGRARSERAAYAEVIAGFAAGEHLALAAPMACPVLGEKSIIHRLRSLTMNDVSSSRRKIGIAAITTTALALPLTASISYAQPPVQQDADDSAIETIDPGESENTLMWVSQDEDGNADAHAERHVEVRVLHGEGADGERRIVRRVIRNGEETEMSEEEFEAMMAELERELEGLDERVERHVELAMRHSEEALATGHRMMVFTDEDGERRELNMNCDGEDTVVERELDDGRRAIMICQRQIRSQVAHGLEAARAAIAANRELTEEMREEILRELDEAMEELRERRVSALTPPKPPRAPAAPAAPSAPTATSVAYSWNAEVAPAAAVWEVIPMVSPITGVSMAPEAQDDCDDSGTPPRTAPRARIRASA